MKCSILCSSKTGNTRQVAEAVYDVLPDDKKWASFSDSEDDSDLVFVGFWTDKGTCPEEIAVYLKNSCAKKIVLFGTAGFNGTEIYFTEILQRVKENVSHPERVLGGWMCQGRMPEGVLNRYEAMRKDDPENAQIKAFLMNYEEALSHPNQQDLKEVKSFALEMIKKAEKELKNA